MGTGAGARTKTQALLYAANWRPMPGKFEDRPASPPRDGKKRAKGLPSSDAPDTKPKVAAYRPGGQASGIVAMMMNNEMDVPQTGAGLIGRDKESWAVQEAPKLEEWEIGKLEKEKEKAEENKKKKKKGGEKKKKKKKKKKKS